MTLARAGIVVAVAGGAALVIHARSYATQAQQESDCTAWHRAEHSLLRAAGLQTRWDWLVPAWNDYTMDAALHDPDMQSLWNARQMVAFHPDMAWTLVPALRDPTFVGLRNADGFTVDGRDMPFQDHGTFVRDDLFSRAGRASWLLKQATAHPAPIVGVKTNPVLLAELADHWEAWLSGLEDGAVCSPP